MSILRDQNLTLIKIKVTRTARMEPYICGINPSRLNVKAHQHSVVMPIIKVVERKRDTML